MDAMTPIARLTRDLRESATSLSIPEARFLVDAFYMMQEQRIRTSSQINALTKSGEPHSVLMWLKQQSETLEKQVEGALNRFSSAHPVGQWMKSQKGVGAVISAGFLAHLDITKAPTAGHFWSFAGLVPSIEWHKSETVKKKVAEIRAQHKGDDWGALMAICEEFKHSPLKMLLNTEHIGVLPTADEAHAVCDSMVGKQTDFGAGGPPLSFSADIVLKRRLPPERIPEAYAILTGFASKPKEKLAWPELTRAFCRRPWNAELKTLCWKTGDCFVKVSKEYTSKKTGRIIKPGYYGLVYRHRKEFEERENELGHYADRARMALEKKNFRDDTIAKKHYLAGRLPPAHIHARASRYTVKLFLSHLHGVWYEHHYKRPPPMPYVISHLGHGHYIPPPETSANGHSPEEDNELADMTTEIEGDSNIYKALKS